MPRSPVRRTARPGFRPSGTRAGATFSEEGNEGEGTAMATAVRTLQNFIDGELVEPAEGRREPVVNPANGETIAEAPESTQADVDRAVQSARTAFESWGNTTPPERSLALLKLAASIEAHADELAQLEATNAGKPLSAFQED